MNPFTASRPNIFLTSFFRSGSSHVKETLLHILPEYHQATTVLSAGEIGNDNRCAINPFAAQVLFPQPLTVFHQHTAGTSGNVSLLNKYSVRPIVQMRNMLDSMLSLVELISTGYPQHLGIYYPEGFENWEMNERLWWSVKNLPNWYFTFYLSWKNADIPIHTIWYDSFYKDQVKGIRGILDHIQLEGTIDDESIKYWAHDVRPNSRLKFGIPGRGKQVFSRKMIKDIKSQAMVWKEGPELIEELIER